MSSTPVHSKEEILSILSAGRGELSRLKIKSLALFGSFARGDFGEQSDVDLIVEFTEPVGFFHFYDVVKALEAMLGRRVDLVMPEALRPEFREQVEKEKVRAA